MTNVRCGGGLPGSPAWRTFKLAADQQLRVVGAPGDFRRLTDLPADLVAEEQRRPAPRDRGDVIRALAPPLDAGDGMVCAIDAIWSGPERVRRKLHP